MKLFRIVGDKIVRMDECERLGWPLQGDHFLMPDVSFDRREFIVYRTVHGVGDWGIVSAMPRMLKEFYPGCKVYVPSSQMLESTWGQSNRHGDWMNPYDIPGELFLHNPHVDGEIDSWDTEIYHDHFRVYDQENPNDPLVLQMMRFHRADVDDSNDYLPELYFSDEEIEEYEAKKKELFGDDSYLAFSARRDHAELSNASPEHNEAVATEMLEMVESLVGEYKGMPALYYNTTGIDFSLNEVATASGMSMRLLLYLISNAEVAIGQQTGVFDTCARYTKVRVVPHSNKIDVHYLKGVDYLHIDSLGD